ncbi:MAG: TetR/AcrR family transcriptional regulator [Rhodospirillaceae bacterium]|nr:TetR/AcrR family transcriptional regulator [Rhodospirillaceae bacterium]
MKVKIKQRLSCDARKEAILKAAREVFIAKGYAATSLDEIVAKSGGSLATLYQLFGNKEGLWRELILTYGNRVTEPFEDAQLKDGPPDVVLRAFAGRLLALNLNPDAAVGTRIIISEGVRFPDMARGFYESGPIRGRRIVADYLRGQVAAGHLEIADPDLASDLFCNMVEGDIAPRSACGLAPQWSPAEIEQRIDEMVRIFLAAYQRKS